jgi:hypothetical protein
MEGVERNGNGGESIAAVVEATKAAPDPICEPCLAGKMHSNPFPSSQWRASRPLELIHTDVHQVPYPSFSGFRYWVSFIDRPQISKLEVLRQLQDDLINGSSRLGCKGHVIHKHRQDDSNVSLDIHLDRGI